MMFTGATQEEAETALAANGDSVVDAIAVLTPIPPISGAKHIPPTPVVDAGHDAATLERIRLGRLMADMLSASARNDLRGKASHYPVKEEQSGAETQTMSPADQPSTSTSQ